MTVRVSHLAAVAIVIAVIVGALLIGKTAFSHEQQSPAPPEKSADTPYGDNGVLAEAAGREAESNVRSAVPAAEAYYAEHESYAGMTMNALLAIDSGLAPSVRVAYAESYGYCLEASAQAAANPVVAHYQGPGGTVADGSCPAS